MNEVCRMQENSEKLYFQKTFCRTVAAKTTRIAIPPWKMIYWVIGKPKIYTVGHFTSVTSKIVQAVLLTGHERHKISNLRFSDSICE